MNSGDPYHSYYQHKVNEFREGKRKLNTIRCTISIDTFTTSQSNHSEDIASTLPASVQKLQVSTAAHQKQQELLKQVAEQQFVPKEAPPEPEFIADPPSISALDL